MNWYKCWSCGAFIMTEHANKCPNCNEEGRLKILEPEFMPDFFGKDFHNFEGNVFHTTVSC